MLRRSGPPLAAALLVAAVAIPWALADRTPRLGAEFRIEGGVIPGMVRRGSGGTWFSVSSAGRAEVSRLRRPWLEPPAPAEGPRWVGPLTPAEVGRLRALLETSEVFGTWDREEETADAPVWSFRLTSGRRAVERTISGVRAFDDVAAFLDSVLALARIDALLDAGSAPSGYMVAHSLRPQDAVRRLRESLRDDRPPEFVGDALAALRDLVPRDEFAGLVAAALGTDDTARRHAVLSALLRSHRGSADDPLLPHAVRAIEDLAPRCDGLPHADAELLRSCAALTASAGDDRAVAALERAVRDLSADGRTPAPDALVEHGDLAFPAVARLLGDSRAAVRRAAVAVSEAMALELAAASSCGRPPRLEPEVAMRPFREIVVPRLSAIADDPDSDAALRNDAARALAALGLRPMPAGRVPRRRDGR